MRIALLSIHTSPLDQPGTGDAGGMNVYIVETAKRLAQSGIEEFVALHPELTSLAKREALKRTTRLKQ